MLLSFFNKNIFSRSFNPVPIFISWLCPFSDTLGISRELGFGQYDWLALQCLSLRHNVVITQHKNDFDPREQCYVFKNMIYVCSFYSMLPTRIFFSSCFFLVYVKISFSFSFFSCCEVSHSFVLQNQNIKWLSNCSLATYFFFFICFYTQLLWII